MKTFLKRQPIKSFFFLTFLISWGGVLLLGAPSGMPAPQEVFEERYPSVFLPYLLGPLVSGLFMIVLTSGKMGIQALFTRLLRWRVRWRWYAAALLTAPLLTLVLLLVFSLFNPAYLPAIFSSGEKGTLLLTGVMVGLFGGGLMEEPGWTGFALPQIRKQRGLLVSGLIIGFIWGVWHILPTYWGSGDAGGALSLPLLIPPLVFYLAVLPAYRVLMVWLYECTESLLIVMLSHASLTASSLFILAPGATGYALLPYYFVLAVVFWIGVYLIRKSAL
jgi:membrane protease YdiL (CAAX protease family)